MYKIELSQWHEPQWPQRTGLVLQKEGRTLLNFQYQIINHCGI